MKIGVVDCVAPTGDVCGEAITWSAAENRLYWVDINRFLLHSLDIADGAVRSRFFDEPVVALSLTSQPGKLLVALASRLILWTAATDEREDLDARLEGFPEVRFNDGRCDPRGEFWVGSMANNVGSNGEEGEVREGLGTLFRFAAGRKLEAVETGIGISNTVCWSPDHTTFYFGDTLKNEIRSYDYDATTGNLSNPRPFFVGFDRGLPDGSTIDSHGYLWNCRFGGQCIVRISPNGKLTSVIEMPVKNATTCTFGGRHLKTLFVTTASAMKGSSDRLAGSVFSIQCEVPGLPENRFELAK